MSDIFLEVRGERIAAVPTRGVNNKLVLTPTGSWFWPFEWDNLDDYLEHYKVERELLKMGVGEDDMVPGYLGSDGEVKLWYPEENPPVWLVEEVNRVFLPNDRVFFNEEPLDR